MSLWRKKKNYDQRSSCSSWRLHTISLYTVYNKTGYTLYGSNMQWPGGRDVNVVSATSEFCVDVYSLRVVKIEVIIIKCLSSKDIWMDNIQYLGICMELTKKKKADL